MASFVGKTGQTTATLHTVSYLVSERSNYRSATKKITLESMWRIIRAEKILILQFGSNIKSGALNRLFTVCLLYKIFFVLFRYGRLKIITFPIVPKYKTKRNHVSPECPLDSSVPTSRGDKIFRQNIL